MNGAHWRRVEEIYTEVAELGDSERRRVLDERRPIEPDVVAEVESLLSVQLPPTQFLSSEWRGGGPAASLPALEGRRVGPFRLLQPIGAGGMGVVHLAEREGPDFVQRVAVKVITAARWHDASLRQFRAERQALAHLHHPHIVALIDGGVTDDGLAYLVMEYVEGVPVTVHCREPHVTVEKLLVLFQQICAAVHYAHRHGVVHRDLKPANVLVTADGVPKILDFGVAKLLTEHGAPAQPTTAVWLRPLTPNYASPEQIRGLPASALDDVYALGVLLFELLTGRTPYETADKTLDEVLRLVGEGTSPRPSDAVVGPPALRRTPLTGDLDAIVLRAIAKDPGRRYGSAQELADDIGRHLAGQAVVAREPSMAYLLATLARRHRAFVAASVVSMLAVLTALGVSVVQTDRALDERNRAAQRFDEVRRLAHTLIFDIHDAVRPLPGSTPVRQQIVAEALIYLERLASEIDDDELRLEVGAAYHRVGTVQGKPSEPNLGDRAGARASYQKAIAVLTPADGRSRETALELARVQLSLSATVLADGRREEALAAARDAQRTAERLLTTQPGDAAARRLLGSAYFSEAGTIGNDPSAAVAVWLKAGDVFESLLADAPENPDAQRNVALVSKYLGEAYLQSGDPDRALARHLRALALDERRAAAFPDGRQAQLDLSFDWSSISSVYLAQQRRVEAAESAEKSLAIRARLVETDPKDDYTRGRLAYAHSLLATIYDSMDRPREALFQAREAVRVMEGRGTLDAQSRLELARYLLGLAGAERKARLGGRACHPTDRAAPAKPATRGRLDRQEPEVVAARPAPCHESRSMNRRANRYESPGQRADT